MPYTAKQSSRNMSLVMRPLLISSHWRNHWVEISGRHPFFRWVRTRGWKSLGQNVLVENYRCGFDYGISTQRLNRLIPTLRSTSHLTEPTQRFLTSNFDPYPDPANPSLWGPINYNSVCSLMISACNFSRCWLITLLICTLNSFKSIFPFPFRSISLNVFSLFFTSTLP